MKPKTEKRGLLKAIVAPVAFLVRAVVGLVAFLVCTVIGFVKAAIYLIAFLIFILIMLAVIPLVIGDGDFSSFITRITKPECVIKGNISHNSGRKLYHLPGMEDYEQTRIDPSRGERWFCTESEAINNGWRKAPR